MPDRLDHPPLGRRQQVIEAAAARFRHDGHSTRLDRDFPYPEIRVGEVTGHPSPLR